MTFDILHPPPLNPPPPFLPPPPTPRCLIGDSVLGAILKRSTGPAYQPSARHSTSYTCAVCRRFQPTTDCTGDRHPWATLTTARLRCWHAVHAHLLSEESSEEGVGVGGYNSGGGGGRAGGGGGEETEKNDL